MKLGMLFGCVGPLLMLLAAYGPALGVQSYGCYDSSPGFICAASDDQCSRSGADDPALPPGVTTPAPTPNSSWTPMSPHGDAGLYYSHASAGSYGPWTPAPTKQPDDGHLLTKLYQIHWSATMIPM